MRYFKRIKDDSLERYGIHVGKIYKEDEIAWGDTFNKVTVAQSQKSCSSNWKEVSEIDYIKQKGWFIKGSPEFGRWLENNKDKVDSNMYNGKCPGLYYMVDKSNRLDFESKNQLNEGIEITVEQLNKIYNNKNDEQMRQFSIKVNPTTSKILQELAFENGYSWTGGNVRNASYLEKPYLHFWKDKTICYLEYDDNDPEFPKVSLEKAIELVTVGEEKIEDGDWFALDNCGDRSNETWIGRYPKAYCYSTGTGWSYSDSFLKKKARRANDKEIKSVLIKEAKRRGFPCKKWKSPNGLTPHNTKLKDNWRYITRLDQLRNNEGIVYEKGIWGEPIDKPEEIFGYKVEKSKDGLYQFGCRDHRYTKKELGRIITTLQNIPHGITVKELRRELSKLYHSW